MRFIERARMCLSGGEPTFDDAKVDDRREHVRLRFAEAIASHGTTVEEVVAEMARRGYPEKNLERLSDILNGKLDPRALRLSTIEELCDITGCKPSEIFEAA